MREMRKRVRRRSTRIVTGLMVVAVACDSPTAPQPDFNAAEWPYLVTSRGVRAFGTSRVLIVAARFLDGAPEPLSTASMRGQFFGGANGGPMAESFALASEGGFTLRGHVTAWVTTSVTVAASLLPGVTAPSGLEDYVIEALQRVEDEVDFGLYDNDGADGFPNSGDDDGMVDGGVAIINSEKNKYCNVGTGLGPHPFARSGWRINGERYKTLDASMNGGVIEIGAFTAMSATGCGGQTVAAHILSHELGHLFLGLPDLYHQLGGVGEVWATRRWVVGCWELMAAAAWGCTPGPPGTDYKFNTLGAWTRMMVGWATPHIVDIAKDSTYDLFPMGRGGTVLRVPITTTEYLLLDYRESTVGDIRLPANGVLIHHIADTRPLHPSSGAYRVSLIEADDDSLLLRTELQGGNRGQAGDAFGISRTTFRNGEHSRAKAVDGSPLPFAISEISISTAMHRARVRIAPVSLTLSGFRRN